MEGPSACCLPPTGRLTGGTIHQRTATSQLRAHPWAHRQGLRTVRWAPGRGRPLTDAGGRAPGRREARAPCSPWDPGDDAQGEPGEAPRPAGWARGPGAPIPARGGRKALEAGGDPVGSRPLRGECRDPRSGVAAASHAFRAPRARLRPAGPAAGPSPPPPASGSAFPPSTAGRIESEKVPLSFCVCWGRCGRKRDRVTTFIS